MTKLDTIKKAYGNYSDVALGLCDDDGWIRKQNYYTYFPQDIQKSDCGDFLRPKSLKGIEDNNGWIKIESDNWLKTVKLSESLTKYYVNNPKEDYLAIILLVPFGDELEQLFLSDYLWLKEDQNINEPTHYKPMFKLDKPLY